MEELITYKNKEKGEGSFVGSISFSPGLMAKKKDLFKDLVSINRKNKEKEGRKKGGSERERRKGKKEKEGKERKEGSEKNKRIFRPDFGVEQGSYGLCKPSSITEERLMLVHEKNESNDLQHPMERYKEDKVCRGPCA